VNATYLELSALDPVVARDGRPFGAGQGNRMRGLPWPFPSVVAGSFRTALVKATGGDFSGNVPAQLMELAVHGLFPVSKDSGELHLPAPNDCVWDENAGEVHRAIPMSIGSGEGCDAPDGLQPVLHAAEVGFKPKQIPLWWPLSKYIAWLTQPQVTYNSDFFNKSFLQTPRPEDRTQVEMGAETGAVEEGNLFTTTGLRLGHLPRFTASPGEQRFAEKFAEITLTTRVETGERSASGLSVLHPLGGERRLVHWKAAGHHSAFWKCPGDVTTALSNTNKVRMVLATPAVFKGGWKPAWLNEKLEGSPPNSAVKLKLVGASIQRWRAVSGWSLAPPRGPKPIKRLVPADGVYFFEVVGGGNAAPLADRWLQPVSDDKQDQLDGFGLATWGTWGDVNGRNG
jgi:CRISPR-associated protein Cmr3